MRISARAEYAARAITQLVISDGEYMQISDIAAEESIPAKFLEQILLELKRAGIITSKRGICGGYRLARAPEEITLGEVIRIFDGPFHPVGGIERMRLGDGLTEAEHCLGPSWLKLVGAIEKIVDSTDFRAVASRRRAKGRDAQPITHGTALF